MKEIDRLEPRAFTRFCMSIGAVPSSYITGLTIEEQLLWFCSYLEKEVIPAVNNNAEAVTELQNLYIQLKQYVDDYFDNLDIQSEVNTKLDEMAQSGELAELISQYLEAQAIIGFNTCSALAGATNLAAGSFARTMGRNTYLDGYGAFYKVRARLNSDDPDGYHLIVLTETDNLVAEMIPDATIASIQSTLTSLQNQINNITSDDIIFISDSYGAGYTPDSADRTSFVDYFEDYTGVPSANIYKGIAGGTGFYATEGGKNFTNLLEDLDETITDKTKVKRIYVVGGYNDQAETYSNIWGGIQAFFTYANTNYPNATIYVGFVGYDIRVSQSGTREAIYTKGIPAYKKCIELGGIYLNNIDYILHNPRFMSSDSVHPNEEGQKQLGRYLACNYKNVGYEPQRLSLTAGKINSTKYNLSPSNLEDSYIEIGKLVNNNVTTYSVKMELNSTVSFNITATKFNISTLSTITNDEINQAQFDSGSLNKVIKTRVSSNSTFYDYNAVLEFDGSNLSIRFYQSIPNVTSIFIPYQEFELPSILC